MNMTHQPDEVFIPYYDDNEFDNLDGKLTSFIYSQADNSIFNGPLNSGLPSPLNKSLALNNRNEILNGNFDPTETLSSEHLSEFDEPLFPDAVLGESSLMDTFEGPDGIVGPMNEVTTTISENDNNDMASSIPSELNLTPGAAQTTAENVSDRINLKFVDSFIQKQLLSVSVHPSINPRRRYKREGKRRIKRMLDNPTTIDLSKLKQYKVDPGQLLCLRISLITHSDNLLYQVYIHPDKLKYYSDEAWEEIDGSVCIPITQTDIENGKIELRHLSIIKKKDNMYTFKLIPYSLSKIDNESEIYTIDETKRIAANAKIFRKKYNVKASRIACQILIKENGLYDFTHITCVTNLMIEQKYEPTGAKPNKRLMRNKKKPARKHPVIKKSKSTKRKKLSNG